VLYNCYAQIPLFAAVFSRKTSLAGYYLKAPLVAYDFFAQKLVADLVATNGIWELFRHKMETTPVVLTSWGTLRDRVGICGTCQIDNG